MGGSWVKLSIFWIDIHKCRIELQSVFIRNRRVSHCWKLSPIFDVTVILLLYLFFAFASKYSKPLTSFDSFVLSLPLHRQTNWKKIFRFHLPHKIGNVLRMIPDLPCKGKYLSLYLYPWTIFFQFKKWMQSDFSCCLSFIQIHVHVHLQGVNLSLLTFYFRSGLSFVEMYIEWRGNTCLLWFHTHKKNTTSDGVVHNFIISWKHL